MTFNRERRLELPASHSVPITWLLQHGNETVRLRTYQEFLGPDSAGPGTIESLTQSILSAKATQAIIKKQKDDGLWGGNILALTPSAKDGIKEIGTVGQHRRLLQLGLPHAIRPFKLAERLFFRLLSRDDDPSLLFEYQKLEKEGVEAIQWAREYLREGAAAALAEAGYQDDPRIRGAAHRIVSNVSQYIRSPLAEKPFVKIAGKTALSPEAHPPTWYSFAMIAMLPTLQRERAGFTERLGQYLALPAPKKTFSLIIGKKTVKADYLIMGDPIEADPKGNLKDIPLALYTIELLARLGQLMAVPSAVRALARLLADCDEQGVWQPKTLKNQPKPISKATYHWYPLHPETKEPESRLVDITFRLALVAKLLGWQLNRT